MKNSLAIFPNLSLVFCKDSPGLTQKLEVTCDANKVRIFIDSSKKGLKEVLLHNGDKYTSLPVAHPVQLKETYENMVLLLGNTKHAEHNWLVCGNLKVIGILLG